MKAMKKLSYKALAIVMLSVFTLTSCFDDDVSDNFFNDDLRLNLTRPHSIQIMYARCL